MGLYEFVGTIYKVTANQVAKLDKDPSPCLFSSLEEGKTFSELNLAYAYLLMTIQKKFTTINMMKGLYQYNHLGVPSISRVFPVLIRPTEWEGSQARGMVAGRGSDEVIFYLNHYFNTLSTNITTL